MNQDADNDCTNGSLGYADSMMDVVLEPEPERLLVTLVEATRSLPPEKRDYLAARLTLTQAIGRL
jgi:hypothetical protein